MAKPKLPAEALEFFREQGRKGGKLSSAARMEKMTPEQRSAAAKAATAAREAKRRRRRYALALPPRTVLRERLADVSLADRGLFIEVALRGEDPAELARRLRVSDAEVLRRVQEAIRKLNAATRGNP